jgi:hypothetical protein
MLHSAGFRCDEVMLESSVTYPRFVFTLIAGSRIVVSYQGTLPAHAQEIQKYGELIAELADQADVRCLWYTEGPRPTRDEQERLSGTVPKHQWRVALVSSSLEMRFVASAFCLVNRNLKYFTPEDLPLALRHMECTLQEQSAVQLVLAKLKHSVERNRGEPVRAPEA